MKNTFSQWAGRPVTRVATITMVITLVLIVVGAATRVYDAGMSCPDWPHCYGLWWPWPESRVMSLTNPMGYVVNGQHYQGWQVALEWGHRLLAAMAGVGLLVLLARYPFQPLATRKALGLPLLVTTLLLGVQIGLGGLTVLKNNIHWSVAMHLGTAMLFLAGLVWLRRASAVAAITQIPNVLPTPPIVKTLGVGMAILVWSTMIAGAMVSSSHSGGVCGGLWSCDGQWFPADFGQHLHMNHRYMALAAFALSIALMVVVKRKAPHLRKIAVHIHGMVLGQAALGIATLYSFSHYPESYYPLSIIHLTWGTFVWLGAIGLLLNLRYGATGRFHG